MTILDVELSGVGYVERQTSIATEYAVGANACTRRVARYYGEAAITIAEGVGDGDARASASYE